MAGIIGNLLILTAFVASILATVSYYLASRDGVITSDWRRIGRISWSVVAFGSITAFGILIYLIATHQFQYAYVYENSSCALPGYFLVSAAWAGQDGPRRTRTTGSIS